MSAVELLAQILDRLGEARVRCPEFRFGQMIAAIGSLAEDETGFSLWDVDDADFLAALDRFAADMAARSVANSGPGIPSSPATSPPQPLVR